MLSASVAIYSARVTDDAIRSCSLDIARRKYLYAVVCIELLNFTARQPSLEGILFGRFMTIERALKRSLQKPWGSANRLPWSSADPGQVIGEIWFGRGPGQDADSELLLKLLFTSQPLSIQVHPDDALAHSLGLPRGKTEAWYVLSAGPGASVARGLLEPSTPAALRAAIEDGSIRDLVRWQQVQPGETIAIPAGTIHALGANLVVAELQQRSDTTFRLYDFGRGRDLQADLAVAAADTTPLVTTPSPRQLTSSRTLLLACPDFVLERIDLRPGSRSEIRARTETWLLVIDGTATVGPVAATVGDAVFIDREAAAIIAGQAGMTALVGIFASVAADDFLVEQAPS